MQYAYSKRRSEFGRVCYFSERPTEVLTDIVPDPILHNQYIRINPSNRTSEAISSLSEHEAGTEYIEMKDNGINHEEGGWPKDISASDIDHTTRYRKKLEREEPFIAQMSHISQIMEHCILQNNAIDIYEEYFEDCDLYQYHPQTSAKNVVTLRDLEDNPRPACHLSWHPDGPEKVAVAHCSLDFQSQTPDMSIDSYIWRTDDIFSPDLVLHPSSPAVCIKYCPKDVNLLAGGQYNGQVVFWDLRRSCYPTEKSALEFSHRDPVYDVVWIHSKSGYECFSTSTDGKVMWWDLRNMKEPEEQMYLDPTKKDEITRVQGGTCLEYDPTMPSKFLVGTESGNIFSCSRRAKAAGERVVSVFPAHHGPICALHRNPFYPKNFLTVGDWSAKIWSEDGRDAPIIWTPKYCEYLTDGCWSATRPSVFFVTKVDGTMDIWDLLYRMKGPEYSVQVCNEPLCCINAQESGELVALGTEQGSVIILRLDRGLVDLQPNERNLFVATVDRGIRREKILETKEREKKLVLKKAQDVTTEVTKKDESHKTTESIEEVEKRFYEVIEKELKRIQQLQLKSVPSETMNKGRESGVSFAGGGDSVLSEKLKEIKPEEYPAHKMHSVIAEVNVRDVQVDAAKDTATLEQSSAVEHSATAKPTIAEHMTTVEQPAVVEHSDTVKQEHLAVSVQITVTEHPAMSEQPAIAESSIAESDAVAEHATTVEQPAIAEHPTTMEQSDTVKHEHSAGLVQITVPEYAATSEQPAIAESAIAESDAVAEHATTVEQPAVTEHPTAVEHSDTVKLEQSPVLAQITASEYPATSDQPAIAESTIAESDAVAEHATTVEQPAVTEHPAAMEHSDTVKLEQSPVLAQITVSEYPATSDQPAVAESTIAESDAVAEPTVTVEQPTVVEHLIAMKHSDAIEQEYESVVMVHTTVSEQAAATSTDSAVAESAIAKPDAITELPAPAEQPPVVEQLAAVEQSNVVESQATTEYPDKTEHSEIIP